MRTFTIALSLLLGSAFTSASDAAVKPTQTLPATCTTTSRYGLATHSCYTATRYTTRIGGCERLECPPRTQHVECPLFIPVTTVEVPCKTDCCPTTPTHVVTTPCPQPCPECPHSTQTQTVTTGCPVSY
ncbi:hypothetical protein PG985_011789 [Apiospora marii]|uniref:Uncharacterized protein n=1 Tax=Apiospora marii TaxID=335849 RepID=A0ABR1R0Q7_9PEZI